MRLKDLASELSQARLILRTATESGRRSQAASEALARLRQIAERRQEHDLYFEYERWSMQLSQLPTS